MNSGEPPENVGLRGLDLVALRSPRPALNRDEGVHSIVLPREIRP